MRDVTRHMQRKTQNLEDDFGGAGTLRGRFSFWQTAATDPPFAEWMGQAAGQDLCHVDSEVPFLVVAVVEAVTCLRWLAAAGAGAFHVVQGTALCRDLPGAAAPAGDLATAGRTRARLLCLSFPLPFPWQVRPISA